MPGPPLGPSYRMTTTSPAATWPPRMPSTASSWLSNTRRAGEPPAVLRHAGGLHDRPLGRQVAVEHGQAAVGAVGVLPVPDAALPPGPRPARLHRASCEYGRMVRTPPGAAWNSSRASGDTDSERMSHWSRKARSDGLCTVCTPWLSRPSPVQLAQDGRDAASPVHVLHVVAAARRHLAQARHPPGQLVDLLQPEADPRLVGGGEQVQDRVGRAAHRDVERHGVLERVPGGDATAAAPTRRRRRSTAGPARPRSRPPARTAPRRAVWVASVVPLPGSDRPIASVRQFMELAVNMPEHEPQVGQAASSSSASRSSDTEGRPTRSSGRSGRAWRRRRSSRPRRAVRRPPSARRTRTPSGC